MDQTLSVRRAQAFTVSQEEAFQNFFPEVYLKMLISSRRPI